MKLTRLPDSATIMACRGRVDFYLWTGIPVARRWPVSKVHVKSAAEQLSVNQFSAAATMTGAIDATFAQTYKAFMTTGYGVTWVDAFRAFARGKPWVVMEID